MNTLNTKTYNQDGKLENSLECIFVRFRSIFIIDS